MVTAGTMVLQDLVPPPQQQPWTPMHVGSFDMSCLASNFSTMSLTPPGSSDWYVNFGAGAHMVNNTGIISSFHPCHQVCRGQPRGSPKTTRRILLKTYKKPKLNTCHLSTHAGHDPHCGVPTAHQSGPLKGPLERVPPRSRVHTSLEEVPPHSRVHDSLERAPPHSRVHLRLARGFCTRMSAPAHGYEHLML
jgi:hypothetical protein